jgi:hypothetical protein
MKKEKFGKFLLESFRLLSLKYRATATFPFHGVVFFVRGHLIDYLKIVPEFYVVFFLAPVADLVSTVVHPVGKVHTGIPY